MIETWLVGQAVKALRQGDGFAVLVFIALAAVAAQPRR